MIATEGGNDRVAVEAAQVMSIFGGDGNDTITFGPLTLGAQFGGEGDDVLTAAGEARLEGGPGNDLLTAGASSDMSGRPGHGPARRLTAGRRAGRRQRRPRS